MFNVLVINRAKLEAGPPPLCRSPVQQVEDLPWVQQVLELPQHPEAEQEKE